ncbi:MAG: FG-GAP repeat protein, partial [Planctomycetaceae bacterium]|nr:FG-GAP repeat protein [Planctomycetaceae bacterium]
SGGVFVAAGHLNPSVDDFADIVTGAGAGGGPHVRGFSGADQSLLVSYFAYALTFTGGVSVATADLNGDGVSDIITGAGPGGGPHVRAIDGADTTRELAGFFPFDSTFGGGVFVGAPAPLGENIPTQLQSAALSVVEEKKNEEEQDKVKDEPLGSSTQRDDWEDLPLFLRHEAFSHPQLLTDLLMGQ